MEEAKGQLGVQAPNSGAAEVGGAGSVQRERELKHSGHRTCLPGALQRPESFSDFVGRWVCVFIYLVLFYFVFSYSLFRWEGARLPVCMFLQP